MEALTRMAPAGDPDVDAVLPTPPVRHFEADDLPPLARAAADVFAARLKVSDVGPDDDFFDLGGGPFSAASAARRLERVVGRPVPPALIYHARTPRRVGEALEAQRQAETSHLVDLSGDGDGPELFCMPEVYGRPMSFITLADRTPPSLPVVGLAVGPAAGALLANESMDDIAAAYVGAILGRRPDGPHRIAGYSFGGTFAHEVARLLHELGHDVSLVLIDAPNRVARPRPLLMAAKGVSSIVSGLGRHGLRPTVAKARRTLRVLPSYFRGVCESDVPGWVPASDRALCLAHARAWRRHRPGPFRGRTLMVVCREQEGLNACRNADGLMGWSGLLAGEVTRVVADVGHQEVVREEYVDRLAGHIAAFVGADR